jgi:hypothetical protein
MENSHHSFQNEFQSELEGATSVLVLGILSIIFAGLIGLILGIIGLNKAGQCKKSLELNPGAYTSSSVKNMEAGRICALIGTILSSLALFIIIVVVVIAIISST